MIQNYLIIEDNVVTNLVVWDGGSDWTPPVNSIQLIASDTNAKVWQLNADKTDYELVEQQGIGGIGYAWDGSVLITNKPKPTIPVQPTTSGTTTI
jgi:hypothetical protein